MQFRYEWYMFAAEKGMPKASRQIIEPHDQGISLSIRQHQELRPLQIESLRSSPLLRQYDDSQYFEYIGSLCHHRQVNR